MESGYNYQYLCDLLKSEGYNVKVAHPLMVKVIAYAKVKTDKVDARILADLLRTDMIPECYIPDEKIRNLRDLGRRRHYFVNTRGKKEAKTYCQGSIILASSLLRGSQTTADRLILEDSFTITHLEGRRNDCNST